MWKVAHSGSWLAQIQFFYGVGGNKYIAPILETAFIGQKGTSDVLALIN